MKIIRLKDTSYPQWEQLWTLYQSSFPHYERRDFKTNLQKMATDDQFHFCAVESFENVFVGLICYWECDNLCFIEHLAIEPQLRGASLGARILGELSEKQKNKIILLEIDPPMDEIAIRREHFYIRNGYNVNHYLHIHPSFEIPKHPHRLIVMSHPRELTQTEFDRFREYTMGRILA